MRKKLSVGLLAAIAISASIAALAHGERVQLGNLVLNVDAGFQPSSLSKHHFSPIGISGHADIGTVDGTLPSALRQVVVNWDRNGRLTTRGLPRCDSARIEQATTDAARSICGKALIGTGSLAATIASPGEAPVQARSLVLIFNGIPDHGRAVILLHAYAYLPTPTAYVIPVIITKLHGGRYGYQSSLEMPSIADGHGVVTHFAFSVRRRYRLGGRTMSVVSARCPDQHLQVAGTISFADGSMASGSIVHGCHGRG